MAGKIGRLKIFGYDLTFVFRHKFEKKDKENLLHSVLWWNDYRLGFIFKRSHLVGSRNFKSPNEWNNNTINEYMIGIELLVCKGWFAISRGSKKLEIKG